MYENWAIYHRIGDLPDDASPWDVAVSWIAEGLIDWGRDDEDPEEILIAAVKFYNEEKNL